MCEGELETGTDCHILTQSSSDHSSTSFSSWLSCSTVGHWGPMPSVCRWLSLRHLVSNWLQLWLKLNWLTQAVCGTWLYNCLTSTCLLWAYASAPNSTTSTGQGDIPISSTGCTCFAFLLLIYTGASLDWRLGRGSICNIPSAPSIFVRLNVSLFISGLFFTRKYIHAIICADKRIYVCASNTNTLTFKHTHAHKQNPSSKTN